MPNSGNKIFLGYPVTFTDAEGEGVPQLASPDMSTSTPVYILGTMAPSVGDILPAYAVGGRWVAERGSSSGSGVLGCLPCNIPKTNLTLSWVNPLSGNGSTTLTYTPIPISWVTTACFNGLKAELVCTGGQVELRVIYWTSGACPGPGLTQYCSNLRRTVRPDPLQLHLLAVLHDFPVEIGGLPGNHALRLHQLHGDAMRDEPCIRCPVPKGTLSAGLEVRRFCELLDPWCSQYDPGYREVIFQASRRQENETDMPLEFYPPSASSTLSLEEGDRILIPP